MGHFLRSWVNHVYRKGPKYIRSFGKSVIQKKVKKNFERLLLVSLCKSQVKKRVRKMGTFFLYLWVNQLYTKRTYNFSHFLFSLGKSVIQQRTDNCGQFLVYSWVNQVNTKITKCLQVIVFLHG